MFFVSVIMGCSKGVGILFGRKPISFKNISYKVL